MTCIAITKTAHGKWTYYAATRYVSGIRKSTGEAVWLKDQIVYESTTYAKTERHAAIIAKNENAMLLPNVRHCDPIKSETPA